MLRQCTFSDLLLFFFYAFNLMYKKTINLDTKSNTINKPNIKSKKNFLNDKKKYTPSRSKKSIKYNIDLDNQPSKITLEQSTKFNVNDSKNNNSFKTNNNSNQLIKIKKNIEKSPVNNIFKHNDEKKKILQNKPISDSKNTIAILKKNSQKNDIQADNNLGLSDIKKNSQKKKEKPKCSIDIPQISQKKKEKPKCSIDIPKISQKKKSLKNKIYSKKKSQVKSKNNITIMNTISNNFINETEKKNHCKQQLIPKYFNDNNLKTNNKITFKLIKDSDNDFNVKVRTNINYFTKKNIDNEHIDINKAKEYLLINNYIKNNNIPDNMVKHLFVMFNSI